MWKYISIIVQCVALCSYVAAYTVARSNQVAHYHYDPPTGERLELPIQYERSFERQTYPQYPLQQQKQQQQHQEQYQSYSQQQETETLTSSGYNTVAAASSSDSVRLPLPLGVASINIAPLPLQEGVSYSVSPYNSYGTTYPQRIR